MWGVWGETTSVSCNVKVLRSSPSITISLQPLGPPVFYSSVSLFTAKMKKFRTEAMQMRQPNTSTWLTVAVIPHCLPHAHQHIVSFVSWLDSRTTHRNLQWLKFPSISPILIVLSRRCMTNTSLMRVSTQSSCVSILKWVLNSGKSKATTHKHDCVIRTCCVILELTHLYVFMVTDYKSFLNSETIDLMRRNIESNQSIMCLVHCIFVFLLIKYLLQINHRCSLRPTRAWNHEPRTYNMPW